jgi:protein-tyrosine phosphatase
MRKLVLQSLCCFYVALSPLEAKAESAPAGKQVLFVCTGNYYRSRFAEALFNQKARQAHSGWVAVSRGLRLDSSQQGISPLARQQLEKRGVSREFWEGAPKPLTRKDLERSDYVVLMDETEHRPMLEKQFPSCNGRKIHYWHIGETGAMSASQACQLMAGDIGELLKTLAR